MSILELDATSIINPIPEEIKKLLLAGEYIICCDIQEPCDLSSIIIENVISIQNTEGIAKHLSLVQYTVSNNLERDLFTLHDDVIFQFTDEKMIDRAINGMLNGYSIFILDKGNIDKTNIYGKLGTVNENKIVCRY